MLVYLCIMLQMNFMNFFFSNGHESVQGNADMRARSGFLNGKNG